MLCILHCVNKCHVDMFVILLFTCTVFNNIMSIITFNHFTFDFDDITPSIIVNVMFYITWINIKM